MEKLPNHVATGDEHIEAPWGDRYDGPDMRNVLPVETMLRGLRKFDDDDVSYVELWRQHAASAGLSITLHYDLDGERHLFVGSACDAQVRHRSRWTHFLFQDLDKVKDRRRILMDALRKEGRYIDERPAEPRQTTIAIRDFLVNDGRILISPEGELMEGGGVPRPFLNGTDHEATECVRANKAYFRVRRRFCADRQIRRAVRMLGHTTNNGWWVLEAQSH